VSGLPERDAEVAAEFVHPLPNSTMVPSPISFTMRPLWAGDCGVEDGFPVPFESGQRARLVGCHQARIADYVGGKDCRQSTVDALFGHE
jgi:hypothetical protein